MSAGDFTIHVVATKSTMLTVALGVAFGVAAGMIVGFGFGAHAGLRTDDQHVETMLMSHRGKVYRLAEVHP
jgi:hypothetical protein